MVNKKVVHQLNVTETITNKEKTKFHNRKPYDDRAVKPGEVLVPMMATDERIKLLGANKANIRTWKNVDYVYHVMFYPVPKSAKKLAMQQFSSELNEFLGNSHYTQCLVPQEDGSLKICSMKNISNFCACMDCPHNNTYNCKNKAIDSLDALLDAGFEPPPSPSAEDVFMESELFAELMQELHDKYPREEQVVIMSLDGKDKKTIIEKLKLDKKQGDNVISQTMALVKTIIRS